MPNENNVPQDDKQLKLDRQVETTILGFQEQNGGKFPTQKEVRDLLGGSFRELSPSIKRVTTKLQALQSSLATMPEMPDQLRQTGDQFIKEVWATARERAEADLADMRRTQEARDEDYRRQLSETEEALFQTEEKLEAEVARTGDAAARITELEAGLAEMTRERDALQARLDERSELFALLGLGHKEDGVAPQTAGKPKARDKAASASGAADGADTADLPMT